MFCSFAKISPAHGFILHLPALLFLPVLYKLNVAQNTFVNKPHSRSTWAHFHENIQFNSSPDPWKINRAAANLPKVVFTHEVWFMRNLKCTAEDSLRVWSHLCFYCFLWKQRKDQTHWMKHACFSLLLHLCAFQTHEHIMTYSTADTVISWIFSFGTFGMQSTKYLL